MSNFITRLVAKVESLPDNDKAGHRGIITNLEMKNLPAPNGNLVVKIELEVSPAIAMAILSATYKQE